MAHYQISVDAELLHQLFDDDEGVAKLVESVLNQVLQAQVTEHLKAQPYERTQDRLGYRQREMKTRVGTLELRVPRVRDGSFSTDLFERYQRSERALLAALMEMVINGVSTRKVRRITEELCGTSFSKSTVSELCKTLDPQVSEWNERPLGAKRFPFVIVDAMQLKVRQCGRVVPQSALIAVGVEAVGTGGVRRDGPEIAAGLRVHDPLRAGDHLQPPRQIRALAHHADGNVKHQTCLVLVASRQDNLGARLAVAHQQVKGNGGRQRGFSVLSRNPQAGGSILPQAVRAQGAKQLPDKMLLPRAQPEWLPRPLPFDVPQRIDEADRSLARVHRVSSSSSKGSLTPAGFTSKLPRAWGVRPNRAAQACAACL